MPLHVFHFIFLLSENQVIFKIALDKQEWYISAILKALLILVDGRFLLKVVKLYNLDGAVTESCYCLLTSV